MKEKKDLARISQSDAPGLYAGIVTPDRAPKGGDATRSRARETVDDLPYRPRRAPRR